jgi:ABC-type microcin C transport system permease subunit YejB
MNRRFRITMEFIEYLLIRHNLIKGQKEIKEKSANQYNNRLTNLIEKNIYNGEKHLDNEMLEQINKHYCDKTNHYPRTIKYYIEFLNYLNELKLKN